MLGPAAAAVASHGSGGAAESGCGTNWRGLSGAASKATFYSIGPSSRGGATGRCCSPIARSPVVHSAKLDRGCGSSSDCMVHLNAKKGGGGGGARRLKGTVTAACSAISKNQERHLVKNRICQKVTLSVSAQSASHVPYLTLELLKGTIQ